MPRRGIINTRLQWLGSGSTLPMSPRERWGCSQAGALHGRAQNHWTFAPPLTSFRFIKYARNRNALNLRWESQEAVWDETFKVKALRVSSCSGNAGRSLHMEQQFCEFFSSQLLHYSYQIFHIFTMTLARCLALSWQNWPSRRRNH